MSFTKEGKHHPGLFITCVLFILLFLLIVNAFASEPKAKQNVQKEFAGGVTLLAMVTIINRFVTETPRKEMAVVKEEKTDSVKRLEEKFDNAVNQVLLSFSVR